MKRRCRAKEDEQRNERIALQNRRVSFNQSVKFACEFKIEKRHECETRRNDEMSALGKPKMIADVMG